jgi:hypothetical protein
MKKLWRTVAALAGMALLLALVTSRGTLADVQTDRDDYAPGETVTITGDGMEPGETVVVEVYYPDGTLAQLEVVADENGNFTVTFVLPGPEAPVYGTYTVVATGLTSGNVFTTTFTDASVKVFAAPSGVTFTLTATYYKNNSNCSGSGTWSATFTVDSTTGKNFGVGDKDSIQLEAALTSDQGGAFINWTSSSTFTGTNPICVPGSQGGDNVYYANYSMATTPTSTITTEIHREPGHTPVTSVTMGATIHDQATVTTTVNPIPAESSVVFRFFKNSECSGEPFSTETKTLTGGSFSESVESSSYLVLAADIATGLSYRAVFNSGDTSKVPDAEGDCEPLTVLSSIIGFYYEVIGGNDAGDNPGTYDCTLPASEKGTSTPCPSGTTAASITKNFTNTYRLHVVVANYTGVPISEKVQGGLTAAPGSTYSNLQVTCGNAKINVSKSRGGDGNVVVWDSVGDGKTNNPGFTMNPGDVCELTVDITVKFSGTGLQPLTSSWSEFQCLLDGPNAGFCEKSPYTDSLMVVVS